jgi:predicted permease
MIRWLADWGADIRYALRGWMRQPVYVAIAVVSLAAGIGLNTAVFSIVNAIFLQSIRGVPEPDRIASVNPHVTFAAFSTLRERLTTLDGVAAWQPIAVRLQHGDTAWRRVAPAVSDNYFDVLGVRPLYGRFFAPSNSRLPAPVAEVVVDYEFWRDHLGSDPQIVGETIDVNETRATIVGVAPRAFHGFGPQRPPLWMPMGMLPAVRGTAAHWEEAGETGWRVFGRVPEGGSLGQVNAQLAVAASDLSRERTLTLRADTGHEPLTNASAEKRVEFLLVVVLPLVVVALILWIGCSNVANLLLARAATRRKEIAIRVASGAARWRLIRLLLTESLLLSLAGGAAGLLLAIWCRDLIWTVVPEAPRLAVELDLHVLSYTGAVCVLATLLFGLVPALHATRVDVAPLLKGDGAALSARTRRGARIRTFFLVTQFAASTALLIVTATFVRTIVSTHLGESAALMDRLTLASVEAPAPAPAARAAFWRMLRARIADVPGVSGLTLLPSNGERTARLTRARGGAAEGIEVEVRRVDGGFFALGDSVLVQGVDLPADSPDASARVLVNERIATQLRLTLQDQQTLVSLDGAPPLTITGIVRDDGAAGRVYQRLSDTDLAAANILIRTSDPAALAAGRLRSIIVPLVADRTSVRVTTLREASTGMLQRLTVLALAIGGLVLAIAGIGLYGSVAFVTAQRTREIAIRMAIGAPRTAVLRMLAWQGGSVVLTGCVFGLALSGVAFRFMSGMIFARWTLDPFAVAGVLATFALATLAACYVPGRRATRINPIEVLRAE